MPDSNFVPPQTLEEFKNLTDIDYVIFKGERSQTLRDVDTKYEKWIQNQSNAVNRFELREALNTYLIEKWKSNTKRRNLDLFRNLKEHLKVLTPADLELMDKKTEELQIYLYEFMPKIRYESMLILGNIVVKPNYLSDVFDYLTGDATTSMVSTVSSLSFSGESVPFLTGDEITDTTTVNVGQLNDVSVSALTSASAMTAGVMEKYADYPTSLAEMRLAFMPTPDRTWLEKAGDAVVKILKGVWNALKRLLNKIKKDIQDKFSSLPETARTLVSMADTIIVFAFKRISEATKSWVPFVGAAEDVVLGIIKSVEAAVDLWALKDKVNTLVTLEGSMAEMVNSIASAMNAELLEGLWGIAKGAAKAGIAIATSGATLFTEFITETIEWAVKLYYKFQYCHAIQSFLNEVKIVCMNDVNMGKVGPRQKYRPIVRSPNDRIPEFSGFAGGGLEPQRRNAISLSPEEAQQIALEVAPQRRNAIRLSPEEAQEMRDKLNEMAEIEDKLEKGAVFKSGYMPPFKAASRSGEDFTLDQNASFRHLLHSACQINAWLPSVLLTSQAFKANGSMILLHKATDFNAKGLKAADDLMKDLREKAGDILKNSGITILPERHSEMTVDEIALYGQQLHRLKCKGA